MNKWIYSVITYILLFVFQRLPLVTDESEQILVGHFWVFFLVRSTNVILEEDIGRGGTLGCIGVFVFPFASLLYWKTVLADLERGELALTRRFRDSRVQKFRESVNSSFIDGYFCDSFGKNVGESAELTRCLVELDRELDRRTRDEREDAVVWLKTDLCLLRVEVELFLGLFGRHDEVSKRGGIRL